MTVKTMPAFKMREADEFYGEMPYIQYLFQRNIPNIGLYYPFVTYSMMFYQEKVSAGFI